MKHCFSIFLVFCFFLHTGFQTPPSCKHCNDSGWMECTCKTPHYPDGTVCVACDGLGYRVCQYCLPKPSKPSLETRDALQKILQKHNEHTVESIKKLGEITGRNNTNPVTKYTKLKVKKYKQVACTHLRPCSHPIPCNHLVPCTHVCGRSVLLNMDLYCHPSDQLHVNHGNYHINDGFQHGYDIVTYFE